MSRWNRDRIIRPDGYVMVRVGKGHPLANSKGYAYEHRLVWAAAGRDLPAGFDIHHRNERRDDNRIENLEIIAHGAHRALHVATQPRTNGGRFGRVA